MKYAKAILTKHIDTFYKQCELELFDECGRSVKSMSGNQIQFEITEDAILFYEQFPSGQDMEKRKGDLLFKTPTPLEFELITKRGPRGL